MQALGYMYKRVKPRPEWLAAPAVHDVFSMSGCISEYFADYIPFWRHNGFWLFDSPSILKQVAAEKGVDVGDLNLFYYEAYEEEYDRDRRAWVPFAPDDAFRTNVEKPAAAKLEGFDITTFSAHTSPECSPLSCNSFATTIATNEHCLIESFEEARSIVESDRLDGCEPGPCRIIAVYSVGH